ncbi:hypothetical protein [Oceanobacillus sp. CAU 1775]
MDSLKYEVEEYSFTINLAESFRNRYAVSTRNWQRNSIKTIDFTFMDEGETLVNIFSIVISDLTEEDF